MFIGRKEEIRKLTDAYNSEKSEFVAVYGRRRIGKTFLVRETFKNDFTFYYTGRYKVPSKQQISSFTRAMIDYGLDTRRKPTNWMDVFSGLKILIENSGEKKKVIFLDELPWMDSPGSDFLSSLEYFWNSWASGRRDVLLIICGSASSWIINKIFKNKGGLHNRVTTKIPLKPFSLAEVESLVKSMNLGYSRNNILEGYMAIGGVPLYWSKMDKRKSLAQNINDLFFQENGEFRFEYNELYDSLFNHPDKYKAIIEAIATKKKGLNREEIIKTAKLPNNGRISAMLEDLIECGFIRKYCDLGKKIKDAKYQLIDFFTQFYFSFQKNSYFNDDNYWLNLQGKPEYNTWCGLAFEKICMVHTRQIKQVLGISGISANIFSWDNKETSDERKVQIDLVFERSDNIYSIIEVKYAPSGYKITGAENERILLRKQIFSEHVKSNKGVQTVLITSNGIINPNLVHGINCFIESNDLFRE